VWPHPRPTLLFEYETIAANCKLKNKDLEITYVTEELGLDWNETVADTSLPTNRQAHPA